jgi:hypothetical protein
MSIEIFPSSFRCDCGQELDFFENTVKEIKMMSKTKRVRLGDHEHTIVFYKGEAIEIICPQKGKCIITGFE